jgi:hypothetical protein
MEDVSTPRRRALNKTLITLSVVGYLLVLATLVSGGFSLHLAGLRVSSHNLFRPFAIATCSLALAVALSDTRARQLRSIGQAVAARAVWIAAAASVFVFLVGIRNGTFSAGGSDAYGYVSQSGLWLKGSLVTQEPLAREAPWPDPDWAFAPLGYRPGPAAGTIVPTYAPGYPIVMALFVKAAGETAAFYVVPALGALAVWFTFVIGTKVSDPMTGAVAAVLLAASPIFLFQLVVPMSDVPVTAWWVLSVALALEPSSPLLSGLAASAAILTRPNLFPLASVIGLYFLARPGNDWRQALWFMVGVVPGFLSVAAINTWLYGSPLTSGYGSLSDNFSLDRAHTNLVRYPRWLLETQTPWVCLAAAAPSLLKQTRSAWFLLALSLVLFGCYILYLPFDSWTYLRFLLPAIALLLVLSSAVAFTLLRRITWKSQPVWVIALVGGLAVWSWDTGVDRGAFTQRAGERHFVQTGAFIKRALPSEAVLLSIMDSGSIRHYAGRPTVRWDAIPPDSLDNAIVFFRSKGLRPYLVIQEREEAQFKERFSGHSALAALDWPPTAAGQETGGTRIYDPSVRERLVTTHPGSTPPGPPNAGP